MDAEVVAANLQRLYDTIPREGVRCMKDAITGVGAVRAGTMRDTVTADEAGAIVEIHTNTAYARFVEDGRGPVRPKGKANGGADWLHWPADSKGPEVFTKYAGPVTARHFAADTAKKILEYIASFS